MVALTYEKGSKEWDEIIIIAVDNYPQSPEARINAANVAMANGDYTAAEQYLQGVPANIPEAMNSRGILAMAQGDYTKALDLFQQALSAGVTEAAYNITLVRELMNAAQ
jgi:tetratricopeptide (TPR) repeat protein